MSSSRLEYRDLELPSVPESPEVARVPGSLAARLWRDPIRLAGVALYVAVVVHGLWPRPGAEAGYAGADSSALLTYTVQPMDLRVTALDSGTLESASSVNVLSEVEGEAAIISVVPEGTRVEQGQMVVELDSSALRTRLIEQQIAVERAGNARSQAQQASTAAASQAESDVAQADLTLEFAQLDLQNYSDGEYPVQARALQSDTALANEELQRARVQLEFSTDLAQDGYLNQGEVDADRFRVNQAQYKLENAREKERLLKEYTFPRTKRDLESRMEEARRAVVRAKNLAQASVDQAAVNLRAQESTLRLEQGKLSHIQRQIEGCSMRAPQAGVVVYPVPPDTDQVEKFIRQGNLVREQQLVFSIPSTDVLQVSMSIHEAIVNQVKPGMQARVWVDVYPDLELRGEVARVSPLPEPGDWRRTTVKFYETKITLLGKAEGLRPGMSAKVEILLERLPSVLAVPVQSVVQRGRNGLCYVLDGGDPELRRIQLGKSSAEYVAVLEGLSAGESVVLSPDVLGVPAEALAGLANEQPLSGDAAPVPSAGATTESVASSSSETKYEGALSGGSSATGAAEFKIKVKGTVVNYKFETKVIDGPPGASWEVVVDGVGVGSVTLDAAGKCEVEWGTKAGNFPANFPLEAHEGSTVTVGGELRGVLAPAVP